MENGGVDDQLFEVAVGPRKTAAAPSWVTAKTFRHYDPSQSFLLPPSLDDWLPEDHEARFISEAVEDLLDLSVIYGSYATVDGAPPYDPRMMLKLLLYSYSIGVTSSREMERRCVTDVAFRFLSATAPSPRTGISAAVVEATGLSKSSASQVRAGRFTPHVVAWRASRSWSERRSRQGTLDDREVAHMAESPRLVVVPTSPHRRLAEAVAPVGTPWARRWTRPTRRRREDEHRPAY